MKTRSIWMTTLCVLMLGAGLTGCENEIDGNGSMDEPPFYILNEGLWGANNANLAGFMPDSEEMVDMYYYANQKNMGDLANAFMKEDNHLYVVLNGSKYVARLNRLALEEARYTFPEGEGGPRCIDVEDGYAYVTQHGGQVSKIKTKDMTLAGTFKGGDNLEGIVEKDGKLYVANAWKIDGSGNYLYNKEVIVIDAQTMKQSSSIEVVDNPVQMYEMDDRIYVISQGDYAGVQAALQVIDTKAGTSKIITHNVDKITEGHKGLIYGVKSTYDENWNTINSFFSYNPKNGQVSEATFLQDAPSELSSMAIYLLEVDEKTGYIYVGTSDYVNTGTIYMFDKDGKLLSSFDSGGISPNTLIFMD